jgi:site-specific recombinase XerD
MSTLLVSSPGSHASLPSLFLAQPEARTWMRDFFNSHIRNPNTRRAYREAVRQFSVFCAENDIRDLAQALGHDVSHQSAHMPDRKPPPRELAETPEQEKSQDMDIGLSL